jgi:hypothetical protein
VAPTFLSVRSPLDSTLSTTALQRRGGPATRPQLLAHNPKPLAPHHQPEYRHAIKMFAQNRNSERGISRVVVIILVTIGVILLLALITIVLLTPRLDESRKRVDESTARVSIRNIGLSQVNYYSSFGDGGYAPNLASLGPGPDGKCATGATSLHGCMIDAMLGGATCTGTNWCTAVGYKFNVQGICANGKCTDYVISAMPVDALNGSKNFCATSDNAIRSETAAPKSAPFSLQECQALPAIQ